MIQGDIKLKDGTITATASGHTNFALCLLYDAGKSGRLMLQTSILPQREEPYMLSLELARHRIKSFLDISESWSLFHLSDDNPAIMRWEEARLNFTKALVAPDHQRAGELARIALEMSIDASEKLTMAHAHILLHNRYAHKAASSSALGIQVETSRFDEPLRQLLINNIDILTIPMHWSKIEPKEGEFYWGEIDRWVKWARDNRKHIIGGPLLDFTSADSIPPWIKQHEHDYCIFRDKCYDHIERVIQRYGSAISFWNMISGINANRFVRLSVPNMVDLVRTARLVVKQNRRDARVMVELSEPFSEFVGAVPDSCNAKVFLSRLAQEGISLDALGIQMLVGGSEGRITRDLMLMSAKLDEFLHVDFPLIISKLGTPSETIDERYGWWKCPWDEPIQEQWASSMLAIALSKPFVDSVIWTDLYDYNNMLIPTSGFISNKGKPRSVLNRMLSMRNRLKKPLGLLDLPKRKETDRENV